MRLCKFLSAGWIVFLLLGAGEARAAVQTVGDPVLGLWFTEGREAAVELYACAQEICGRFHWFKVDDGDLRDDHNRDPGRRIRPLCKMQFIGGFTGEGEGRYGNGWVYDPNDGATYNASMTLVDRDTLDMRGYVLLPFLGQSQTWKRVSKHAAPGTCVAGRS
jgi:uncharacterized protein (DUF2147 family)